MTKSYDFHVRVEVPDDYYPPTDRRIEAVLETAIGGMHPDVRFSVEER